MYGIYCFFATNKSKYTHILFAINILHVRSTKEHHEKYLKWRLDNGLAKAIEPFVSDFSTVYLNTKDEY